MYIFRLSRNSTMRGGFSHGFGGGDCSCDVCAGQRSDAELVIVAPELLTQRVVEYLDRLREKSGISNVA
jgi:hypothetical protein